MTFTFIIHPKTYGMIQDFLDQWTTHHRAVNVHGNLLCSAVQDLLQRPHLLQHLRSLQSLSQGLMTPSLTQISL
jgi:hypothetical protein